MKNIILAILVSVSAIGSAYAQKKDKWQTIEIKTSTICGMCKENIEGVLAYEKGIKSSNVNAKKQIVTVKYNPNKTTPDAIRKAITLAGYDADEMTADEKAYEKLDDCCKKGAKCEDEEEK